MSFKPNQSNASGSQQIEGSDCNPMTSRPSVSSAHCFRASKIPSGRPIKSEIT